MMLKFLANDFSQAKWKTTAMKNAYALLGKRRFGMKLNLIHEKDIH